jgi:GNAT superfamily N-acetyltransferase
VQECSLERLEDSAPVSGDASLSVSPKHLVRLWGDEQEKDVGGFLDAEIRVESSLLEFFDEAVRWLAGKGLGGQWGTQPWSERPDRRERISRLARSSELTIAEVGDQVVGALEVSESSPSYAPKVHENNLNIYLLLTSRQLIGQGIGRALLNHARADCRTRGLELLRVDCWAGGEQRLVRDYESQGFTATEQFNRDGWLGQLLIQRLGNSGTSTK